MKRIAILSLLILGILSPTLYGQDSLTSLLLIEFSLSLSEHLERHVYVASLSDIRVSLDFTAYMYACT